jgi:hypothetical protein
MIDTRRTEGLAADKRRADVKEQVRKELADGTFTITDTLLIDEPYRSDVWEACDGIVVTGTQCLGMVEEPLTSGTVKLVHIDPKGKIESLVKKSTRIPGTIKEVTSKVKKSFGNFADVPDNAPSRVARNILYRECWPARQSRPGAKEAGTVVEWKWLEREAKAPGALEDYVELYNEIKTRPGFAKFIGAQETEATITKSKAG